MYDKKNIPKVIYCVHALGFILSAMDLAPPIGNLVGKLEFSDDEIQKTQRGLDASGLKLPNFSSVGAHFGEPEPESEPEPEPTEEERMVLLLQELVGYEDEIIKLQALSRGSLLRHSLYTDKYILSKSVGPIVKLQSIIRGKRSRKAYQVYSKGIAVALPLITKLQAISRGKIGRKQLDNFKHLVESREADIITLQSIIRAVPVRKFKKQAASTLKSNGMAYVGLQAAIRGKLVRDDYKQFRKDLRGDSNPIIALQAFTRAQAVRADIERAKLELHRHAPAIAYIQSRIRGNISRDATFRSLETLKTSGAWVTHFQSAARGHLARRNLESLNEKVEKLHSLALAMQAGLRGYTVRKQLERTKLNLIRFRREVVVVQAHARGALLRNQVAAQLNELDAAAESVTYLQSMVRGHFLRKEQDKFVDQLEDTVPELVELQSMVRGNQVRSAYSDMVSQLQDAGYESVMLQSVIRGNQTRAEVTNKQAVIQSQEAQILKLQSIIRAGFVRQDLEYFLKRVHSFSPSVVRLQSIFRGVMVRFNYDLMMDDFNDAMESIVALQAHIRGFTIRKAHNARMEYFKQNMDKVIKIQSFVRAKKQGDAYKSLTSSANPPLSTVKNFVHLLNDSDLDFEQEVQLEQNRKQVMDEITHNEQLEQFINQLDVKIALLLKNKITIDEVVRHRNRGINVSVNSSGDIFDLKALNKASRKRLELYQGFFYLLQTQPTYFARLFKQLRESMVTEKETKDIEGMIKTIFGGAQKRREEYFYLRLVSQSITEEITSCENVKAVLRGNFIWWKLLGVLNRAPKERKLLRSMLYSVVSTVVNKSDLDLESDPLALYRKSIAEEEIRTGQLSQRNPHIPVSDAIRHPETRATYVANLQKLRELTTEFLNTLADNVESLPYHIRFAAREIYNTCKAKFPAEHEDRLLSLVGHVIFSHYLNPAIIAADNYGIINSALGPIPTRNLTEITKVLTQISMLKPFSRDDVYLQPLNDYIKTSIKRAKGIFHQIINVADLNQYYEMTPFVDLTSHGRPTLFIKTSDIFAIHSLVAHELDTMAPEPEDSLRMVVSELGALPNDASEILNIAKFTEVKLDLNPSFCKMDDPEAEINSLLVSAKRCLIYVLRVQSGPNLLEVLVSPVEDYHEKKYRGVLAEEAENREKKKQPQVGDSGLGDLESLTYRELKLLALEKIIELESYGKITREDNYQAILNSIALDIKSKRDRRLVRQKEIDEVRQTLSHLSEKETYLQTKLKTYNNYIEQAMLTLQTKKGKKRGVLPFSKQYFHLRDLQKTGQGVPKFGSYKYTASSLFDKGVLVELSGYTDRQYDKVTFTFSSDAVGVFKIEAAFGSVALPGATTEITLDELLSQQYNNRQYIPLFDNMVTLNTNLTLHFIFKKFYGDSQ